MKYKCISTSSDELWLTIGKIYEGEVVVTPVEFSGGKWLYLRRADDGFSAYALANQFVEAQRQDSGKLGVQ